uniref:Uncharacterized protein n=1 Tax=Myotis myotis TaxID=51298 RepID=A0A7J7Z4T6_MYOMY|nr:hypothetical protein mMyoMyo1_010643 [Myotis myotis]
MAGQAQLRPRLPRLLLFLRRRLGGRGPRGGLRRPGVPASWVVAPGRTREAPVATARREAGGAAVCARRRAGPALVEAQAEQHREHSDREQRHDGHGEGQDEPLVHRDVALGGAGSHPHGVRPRVREPPAAGPERGVVLPHRGREGVHRQQERTGSERTRLQILLNRRHLQVPHDERQGGWFAKVKGGRGSKPGEAESPGAQRSPKSSTDELC